MSTPAFRVFVRVGAWTQTLTAGSRLVDGVDVEQVANDAGVVMDGLRASWDMPNGYPGQPTPTTLSFALWLPAGAAAPPSLDQGTYVVVQILPPDWVAGVGYEPVLDFRGRLADADAAPLDDGLAFAVNAVDFVADLAEERLGDEPWPEEMIADRLTRITDASGLSFARNFADPIWTTSQGGVAFLPRDVDSQPTLDVIEAHHACIVLWQGLAPWSRIGIGAGWPGRGQSYANPPGQYWLRPFLVQHVSGTDPVNPIVTYSWAWHSDRQSSDAALPFRAAVDAGQLQLQPRAEAGELPADSSAAWVPASAVVKDSITWRTDKRVNYNRVRLVGTFVNPDNVAKTIGSSSCSYPELVAVNGPVELSVDAGLIGNAGRLGGYVGPALLGSRYDARPRYTIDSITVDVRGIADGRQWPRFFQQRAQMAGDYFGSAAGRLVFVYGIDDRWNLHRRPETWGQLVGAQLDVSGAQLRITGQLVHRRPSVNGPSSAGAYGGTLSVADVNAQWPALRVSDVADNVTSADLRLTT